MNSGETGTHHRIILIKIIDNNKTWNINPFSLHCSVSLDIDRIDFVNKSLRNTIERNILEWYKDTQEYLLTIVEDDIF